MKAKWISIRALRVEGDETMPAYDGGVIKISIRALRVEGDGMVSASAAVATQFQSAPSAWRATTHALSRRHRYGISIRALRVEGDMWIFTESKIQIGFQSAPSAWRATRGRHG